MNQLELERFQVGVTKMWSGCELRKRLNDPQLTDIVTPLDIDALVVNMLEYIWAEHLGSVTYKTEWWQILREKILLKWWLKKHPSRTITKTFKATYPLLKIKDESHKPVIKVV